MISLFLIGITFISTKADLSTCNSFVQGFVSEYDENGIYFDVGTIANGSTVGFDACLNINNNFNMFRFSLRLYESDSIVNSVQRSNDDICGDDNNAGTYLKYTNSNNYNGSYILQIKTYRANGGSFKITKECGVNIKTTTTNPTPAPTNPIITDTFTCGEVKTGFLQSGWITYKVQNVDFSTCGLTYAFNACPKQTPYVNNMDFQINLYKMENESNGTDISYTGLSGMYFDVKSGGRYCDIANNDDSQQHYDGNYYQFTDTRCDGSQLSVFYVSFASWSKWDFGNSYEIELLCDVPAITTQPPTSTPTSNAETTSGPTKSPTVKKTPSPTLVNVDPITCSSRDLMGNLKSTQSLSDTYSFYNNQQQFVLFSFCSMANFEPTLFLYKENSNGTYDIIASSGTYFTMLELNNACQNITGYFDSGAYWLAIQARKNPYQNIIGMPVNGQAKYLLNVYCSTEAITKTTRVKSYSPPPVKISDYDVTELGCNFVQMSKHDIAPMPIGVCNTKYPAKRYEDNERYSYKAECKADKSGLLVTICPNAQSCDANSCFTVDVVLDSQCTYKNDSSLCDFTVYDYNCQASINCEYTTMRISDRTGDVWDDDFDPDVCHRDDVFYETISMIIDDCYVKKTYGWMSSVISCDELNSITINDYLIAFETENEICSSAAADVYHYNTTVIQNGGCVYGSYIDVTYCSYVASPTESTIDVVEGTSTSESSTNSKDIVGTASYYSIIFTVVIGFSIAALSL